MPSPGAWATLLGFALMALAAQTVIASRQQGKLTQQEGTGVPLAAGAELAAAIVLLLFGSLQLSGDFKPISAVNAARGLQTHNFRPDFMRFNHRGQVLPRVLPADHPAAGLPAYGPI